MTRIIKRTRQTYMMIGSSDIFKIDIIVPKSLLLLFVLFVLLLFLWSNCYHTININDFGFIAPPIVFVESFSVMNHHNKPSIITTTTTQKTIFINQITISDNKKKRWWFSMMMKNIQDDNNDNDDIIVFKSSSTHSCLKNYINNYNEINEILLYINEYFSGDFDNYHQVMNDRVDNGMLPGVGGGHEHIHCILIPLTKYTRLAAYYFNGNSTFIFRFRYYQFILRKRMKQNNISNNDHNEDIIINNHTNNTDYDVDMLLYTLHPQLEKQLRSCDNITLWSTIFHSFQMSYDSNNHNDTTSTTSIMNRNEMNLTTTTRIDDSKSVPSNNIENDHRIQLLPKCDIRWSFQLDPIQHSYIMESNNQQNDINQSIINNNNGLHAIMVYGYAIVYSQLQPNTQQILIKDSLSLLHNQLYIHDRGYNPNNTKEYIYGNQREIPYIMDRVSILTSNDNNNHINQEQQLKNNKEEDDEGYNRDKNLIFQHMITNHDLAWTMGSSYRTNELYQEKMELIALDGVEKMK